METESSLPCSQQPATGSWVTWLQPTPSHLISYPFEYYQGRNPEVNVRTDTASPLMCEVLEILA